MKLAVVLASVALTVLPAQTRAADLSPIPATKEAGKKDEKARGLLIRVADGGWGDATPKEIETLLCAVSAEMLTHFPGRRIDPIIVSHARQAPIVLYEKAPDGEYQVYLAAKDRRWAEFVYEFSHELCHIVANYEQHAPPHPARHQWFEESLCETASLYTLKRMSATWDSAPPRAEWSAYAPAMHRYTERMVNEPHRHLPERSTLADWLRRNGTLLRDNPYLRDRNEVVANQLLPLLEENPGDWEAIGFLNLEVPDDETSFRDYLHHWYQRAPMQHRQFIRRTMSLFGLDAPDGAEAALAESGTKDSLSTHTLTATPGAAGPASE